ncbi:NmrA-like negative transcriptional regulator family protein [Prunus dulcis]|uniref:NmrA-like negative transcriptional regulator family protein n=1 Tax=Prunus dulcis TaxID=3755 RepID=A0A4Y1QNN1_PRUDU|nr:NmrA-like negative transcriptional regulator family protein [Prunus dulcis]
MSLRAINVTSSLDVSTLSPNRWIKLTHLIQRALTIEFLYDTLACHHNQYSSIYQNSSRLDMMACEKSKILIIGATGYLGKYMLKASVSLGHPTYAYVRPIKPKTDSSKLLLHKEFEAMGATIFQGELNDHEKLVKAVEQVDVVISTVAVPQHLEQLKTNQSHQRCWKYKEFGNEVDRISGLPPFEALLDNKRKIRRAIEAAGIPYTFVSANSFGAYFVDYLLHPREKTNHQVTVYGTGEAKDSRHIRFDSPVLNYEEDVATYTIKAATDPRVANRVIVYRPQGNIVSQLDLISSWEKKTGCTLTRSYVPEEEILKLSRKLYPTKPSRLRTT